MDLSEFEQKFLKEFQEKVHEEFKIERNQKGILYLYKESPCAEFGGLNIFIEKVMITLSCKVTHTHCYLHDQMIKGSLEPENDLISEAIAKVLDILNDKLIVDKMIAPNGEVICTGNRHVDMLEVDNPKFYKMLEEQYGGKPITKEWVWSGEYKRVRK